MRMLGKLAVAVGATAVVLLLAPGANASPSELDQLSKSVPSVDQKSPLGGLAGVQGVPIVSPLLNGFLSGVGGGALGGGGLGGLGGGGGLGNLGG
ncbi:hypothetical protein F4560_006131 [Saccharothrix ecbatanensis]|uniref:Secreted protein n=1 Tax=Saccharothrix ecbatanensis TaxID=1105145 RepID=A0A7W9HQT1_9PSEU|nr:hypothetical protein [Saccharothrix ecbatanensis]MBB5806363.1 hypothetical protein [Saccharothrix ecbatanensis]